MDVNRGAGFGDTPMRLLTDIVGTYYTLVMESTFNTLADYERMGQETVAKDEWKGGIRRSSRLSSRDVARSSGSSSRSGELATAVRCPNSVDDLRGHSAERDAAA